MNDSHVLIVICSNSMNASTTNDGHVIIPLS